MFIDKKSTTYKLKSNFDKLIKSLSLNKVVKDVLKARSIRQIQSDNENNVYFDDKISNENEILRKL